MWETGQKECVCGGECVGNGGGRGGRQDRDEMEAFKTGMWTESQTAAHCSLPCWRSWNKTFG